MEMKTLRTIFYFITAFLASSANAQVGSWNGELNVMDTKLPLVFNLGLPEFGVMASKRVHVPFKF